MNADKSLLVNAPSECERRIRQVKLLFVELYVNLRLFAVEWQLVI